MSPATPGAVGAAASAAAVLPASTATLPGSTAPASPPPTVALAAREIGGAPVADALPEGIVAVFAVLTYLGDPFVLMGALGLLYVAADLTGLDRSRVACVVAVGLGALALTLALKAGFALPRPPGAAEDGFGFPSGHALGSTAVYGAVAAILPWGRLRARVAVAGVVVALVSFSRLALGVHYLADVLAGVAVGGAVLLLALRLGPGVDPAAVDDADAGRLFDLALGLALAGAATGLAGVGAGFTGDGAFALGGVAGAWIVWRLASGRLADAAVGRGGAAVGAAALVPILGGLYALESLSLARPAVVVGAGALMGALLALPGVAASVGRRLSRSRARNPAERGD